MTEKPENQSRRAKPAGNIALALFVLSAIAWVPIAGHLTGVTPLAALLLVLYVVFAVRARRELPRARTVVTVLAVLLYVLLVPYAWQGFTDPANMYGAEYAVLDIVALAASATGLALLYLPGRERARPVRTVQPDDTSGL